MKLPETGLKSKAVIALLKNEQPVPAAELLKIAADKEYRADFYRELNGLKKANLFPVQYAKQQSLAESDLYAIVSDEYEVGAVLFLGEKTASYQGKKKKFFLFKITLQFEEGEKESYLGIAGPYDLNTKELISYSDAGGINWQEPFNQSKTGKHFGSYLAGLQSPEE